MRLAALAIVVLICPAAGAQSRWVSLTQHGTPALEADSASSRRHDDHLDVWIKQIYSKPQNIATASKATVVYQKARGKWSIDCTNRRYRVSHVVYHAPDGHIVDTIDSDEDSISWQEPIPETVGEIVVDSVCASNAVFDGSYSTALAAYRDRMKQIDSTRAAACDAEQPSAIVANCRRLAAIKGTTSQASSERWVLRSQLDSRLELAWPAFPSKRSP